MTAATRKRQSKTVTFTYAAVAAALLAVVAAMALVFVPPSPPRVAEFAPQVVDPIVDAPSQQSSTSGSGTTGACAKGQICEAPNAVTAPLKRVIEKARVLRCIGDPPRQIEDPQSPACANFWEGDNGSATSRGVTAGEIRLALSQGGAEDQPIESAMVEFFNRRFQFYGRKLRVSWFKLPSQSAQYQDPPVQRSFAQRVADEFKAFAAVGYGNNSNVTNGDLRPYYDELARRGVLGVDPESAYRTVDQLKQKRPYLWTFSQTLDQAEISQAEWMCKSIVGDRAEFALAPANTRIRKFGIVLARPPIEAPSIDALTDGLKRCGAPVVIYETEDGDDKTRYVGLIAAMKADEITSVICICADTRDALHRGSNDDNFFPEWILAGVPTHDRETQFGTEAGQVERQFGMGSANKHLLPQDSPWYAAVKEVLPDYQITGNRREVVRYHDLYHGLLTLASGIQLAGPNLTPQTFEQGLFKATFPNPGAGSSPYFQGHVGFGPGDYSMVDDYTLIWFSQKHPEYMQNQTAAQEGAWCYIDRGLRYSQGRWPSVKHAFFDESRPCR